MPAKPKLKTKPISWKKIFSTKPENPYFLSRMKREPHEPKLDLSKESQNLTYRGRYREHDAFLQSNKDQVTVFADVGCGLARGAPTTLDARKALGKKSRVLAVDVFEPDKKHIFNLEGDRIEIMKHSILMAPLPVQCDAIRFANVSMWITQSDRRRALRNIWKSLKEGGYLLGAQLQEEGKGERQFVLRKTKRGWDEVILG